MEVAIQALIIKTGSLQRSSRDIRNPHLFDTEVEVVFLCDDITPASVDACIAKFGANLRGLIERVRGGGN